MQTPFRLPKRAINYSSFKLLFLALSFLLPLLFATVLNVLPTNALTVTASPSGSGTGALSFNLTPGIFNKVSQTITVDNTNYHAGYTMTLETTGIPIQTTRIFSNDLIKRSDATKRIPTLSSTITSPDNFNNNWGYSFFNTNIAVDDPLRNTFYPVPGFSTGTNPQPIQSTLVSTTTSSTTPDEYELSFGAKVDTSIPAGNYQNNIVVRVVSNPTTCSGGNICYDENYPTSSTTGSPTSMGNQSITSTATDATLWAANYQYNGGNYAFAGWNTKADGTGTSYGPNQTITDATVINDIKNNGLILYAMWIQSTGDLQNWDTATCTAMNIGDTTALTDNRDGNTYTIAKLADGKCWMVENLRLSNTHATTGQPVAINSANTNNPASGFALNAPQDPTSSYWCTTDDAACIDQSRHATNNTQNPVPNMTDKNSNVYSYGNYYNWYTATAGNGTYSMASGSTAGDICPAGWHLPKGDVAANGGEYSALDIAMGGTGDPQSTAEASNRWRTFPNNFVFSGLVYGSSLDDRGSYGDYWSATARSGGHAYGLGLDSSGVDPSIGYWRKYYGSTLRCVLSTDYTINYDSNGGTGNMSSQTATVGQATNLSANTFTAPSGKVFKGWNTAADGSGASYTDEQEVTDLASAGGSITLYAQWKPVITYNPNGASAEGTTASPSMGDQSIDQSATNITFWPSNFKRPGYGFAGWNTKADGTGTSYGPNQTIADTTALNDIKTNGLILYAIWKQSQGDLQSWTPANCNAMNIGDTTALTDNRDGNTYAIAKLADGKCWMIESLRLSNTHTTTGQAVTINSTNTNNPATGFALNAPQDPTSSSWCATIDADCIDQSRHAANNTANPVPTMTNPNSNVYSYGNYYNWYTATAGNGTSSTVSGSTTGDICPAGWHLPKGGSAASGGEFAALDIAMGGTGEEQDTVEASNRWRTFPNNNLYSGYVSGLSVRNRGSYGDYWSSTVYSGDPAYGLYFNSSNVYPGTISWHKYYGHPVRCLLSTTAQLNTGADINKKLKSLSRGTNVTTVYTPDNLITAFVRSDTLPTGFTPTTTNTISTTDSEAPVYVWFDSNTGTMYYYTEADKILANDNSSHTFRDMKSLANISGLKDWNVGNVTSMYYMFYSTQISDLTPIKDWQVGNVTNMSVMFYSTQISDLTPLKDWNVGNVTNMNGMFYSTQISDLTPIKDWNVGNVTNIGNMFSYTQISDLTPIKDWQVGNVTNMGNMFSGTQISDLTPIKDWNIGNVTSMYGMFSSTQISDLTPIKDWQVGNVTGMGGMFRNTQISDLTPIKDWQVGNVTGMNYMFSYTQISDLTPIKDWQVGNVTDMAYMFYNIPTLTNPQPIKDWNVNKVTNFSYMFGESTPRTNLPIFTLRPGTWNPDGTYIPN